MREQSLNVATSGDQLEIFNEFPPPGATTELASFRIGEKIVQVPLSFWKDGRACFDLSPHGGGIVRSRNLSKAAQLVEDALRGIFKTAEVCALEIARAHLAGHESTPRKTVRKKEILAKACVVYANPFVEDKAELFGKYPNWLLSRRDLKPTEKMVYGRLLFPYTDPKFCERWDPKAGVIFGLNQGALGIALGMSRQAINTWFIRLQSKEWIECAGNAGAKQVIRFLWKDEMPETCRTVEQVGASAPAGLPGKTCNTAEHVAAGRAGSTCREARQVVEGVEKRESKRTNRTTRALYGEELLLEQLAEILPPTEMVKNGGMWRTRIRQRSGFRALQNTIEDFKVRTPDQRAEIHDRPAWFTDRYMRNLVAVERG
jgi:hypothetical protein